jgi:hypothetical protein
MNTIVNKSCEIEKIESKKEKRNPARGRIERRKREAPGPGNRKKRKEKVKGEGERGWIQSRRY